MNIFIRMYIIAINLLDDYNKGFKDFNITIKSKDSDYRYHPIDWLNINQNDTDVIVNTILDGDSVGFQVKDQEGRSKSYKYTLKVYAKDPIYFWTKPIN